jgi:hypothetical protein
LPAEDRPVQRARQCSTEATSELTRLHSRVKLPVPTVEAVEEEAEVGAR